MPYPTRSKRFIAFSSALTGGPILWLATVPAGHKWLIKDVTVFNFASAARDYAFWAEVDGAPYLWGHFPGTPAGRAAVAADRHVVIESGGRLGASISATGTTGIYICGAQLGP